MTKIIRMIHLDSKQELRNQTNMNITQMKKLFGYTSEMKLSETLTGFPYRFKN